MDDKYTPEFILSFEWLKELEILAYKYQSQGVTHDIASMTLIELWGVYQYLRGLGG